MWKPYIAQLAAIGCLGVAVPAFGQVAAPRPAGRISFFVNSARLTSDSGPIRSNELVTTITFGLPERSTNGLEYGIDLRQSQPIGSTRTSRLALYDGYVGARFAGGAMRVRAGHMWLTDLGALGSVAGGLFEYQRKTSSTAGRLRIGGFGGLEPNTYELGYAREVQKYGGYALLEGAAGRRHVAGLIRIDHGGLAERSVVSVSNFVPVRAKVFLYQVLEYDLTGPAGQGSGGLTYFFLNARATVASRVELQGLFNRGRSVDARTITDDLLNGRTVSTVALDGLLYESAGARVTVTVMPGARVHGGYTRDRNNRDSDPTNRIYAGASAQNIAHSGVDLTFSGSQIQRPTGTYHSIYLSGGRQIGRSVYVTADYSSAVSIVRFTRMDGLTVETRPETRQIGGSAMINLNRRMSLFTTITRTLDADTREMRMLSGLTFRLR